MFSVCTGHWAQEGYQKCLNPKLANLNVIRNFPPGDPWTISVLQHVLFFWISSVRVSILCWVRSGSLHLLSVWFSPFLWILFLHGNNDPCGCPTIALLHSLYKCLVLLFPSLLSQRRRGGPVLIFVREALELGVAPNHWGTLDSLIFRNNDFFLCPEVGSSSQHVLLPGRHTWVLQTICEEPFTGGLWWKCLINPWVMYSSRALTEPLLLHLKGGTFLLFLMSEWTKLILCQHLCIFCAPFCRGAGLWEWILWNEMCLWIVPGTYLDFHRKLRIVAQASPVEGQLLRMEVIY